MFFLKDYKPMWFSFVCGTHKNVPYTGKVNWDIIKYLICKGHTRIVHNGTNVSNVPDLMVLIFYASVFQFHCMEKSCVKFTCGEQDEAEEHLWTLYLVTPFFYVVLFWFLAGCTLPWALSWRGGPWTKGKRGVAEEIE